MEMTNRDRWFFTRNLAGIDVPDTSDHRPAHSANTVQLEGVRNLCKVSNNLYRSAQPTVLGIRNVKAIGIRTVVNLRSFHSHRQEIRDAGLQYERIRMEPWNPEENQMIKFLKLVTDNKRTPVLVHCEYGAHRTGIMCLIYRIALQGWTKKEALREMTGGEFRLHGTWHNLIHLIQWINNLDIDRIKEKARIGEIKRSFWSANNGYRLLLLLIQHVVTLKTALFSKSLWGYPSSDSDKDQKIIKGSFKLPC